MNTSEFQDSNLDLEAFRPYERSSPPGVMVYEPSRNQNPESDQGGDNFMGRIDDVRQTYEDAIDEGKSEVEALSDALEYANEKYNEAEEAFSAVQTAVTDLQIDVAQEAGELYRETGRAQGVRSTVESNLSDTEDSIEDMRDDLL